MSLLTGQEAGREAAAGQPAQRRARGRAVRPAGPAGPAGRQAGRAGKRARGGGARMIIPVRCFTCGKVIGNKYENYMAMLAQDGCSEA